MNYHITHTTRYDYHDSVSLCHNEVRLTPRNFSRQACTSSIMSISPMPSIVEDRKDFFGNNVSFFSIQHPHEELYVTVSSYVSIVNSDNASALLAHKQPWELARQKLTEDDFAFFEAKQFAMGSPMIPFYDEVWQYSMQSFSTGKPIVEACMDLMDRIFHDFEFHPGATTVSTPLSEIISEKKGVCQDFAHFGIACFRSVGLAARYMSGYIETLPPEGQEKLVGADASHAWISVYIPDIGWVDFDPTNNQIAGDKYIVIGWGRDYSDIVPMKGIIFSSGLHKLETTVDVVNIGY